MLESLNEYDDEEVWKKIDSSIVSTITNKWTTPESIYTKVLIKIIQQGDRDALISFAPQWIEEDMDILDAVVKRFDHIHERYQTRLIDEYLENAGGPPLVIFFDLWYYDEDSKKETILDIVKRIVKRGITDGLNDELLLKLAAEGPDRYRQLVKDIANVLPKEHPTRAKLKQVFIESKLK